MKNVHYSQIDENLVLKERDKTSLVALEDITYLKCEGYLTTVHTVKNQPITVAKVLKRFESELSQFGFIRVNHNTIVNINKINSIRGKKRRSLVLINEVELEVSRRRWYSIRFLFNS